MTESKSLLEQAIEVLVFAPVGLAVTAAEELPELIEKGRSRISPEISNARIVGRFAVTRGQREAERLIGQATDIVTGGAPRDEVRPRPPASPPRTDGVSRLRTVGSKGTPVAPRPSPPPAGEAAPDASHLAIPGYDSLSASQVVQRLGGLSAEELDAVRAYESSTRRRKTILNRAAQLRSHGDS